MASTANKSISAQNWCLNYIWTYNDGGWNTTKGGYAGHTSGNGYYAAVMQLTTPSWTGVVSSAQFTVCARRNTGSSPTLRWALTSSMENRNSYKNTSGTVSDGYQLASGTVSMAGISGQWGYYSFTASTPSLKPDTTYYLFLWAYSSNNNVELNTAASHTFSVHYSALTTPSLSAASGDMGSTVYISTETAAAASMTHTLVYQLANGSRGTIASGVGATRTPWVVPDCASLVPAGTSTSISVICTTYGPGGEDLGSMSLAFIATVPASVTPTIGAVTVTEAVAGLAERYRAFVQSRSRVSVKIEAGGAKGSTISQITSTLEGRSYTGAAWTAESPLSGSGTLQLSVTVTDSRGRKAVKTAAISVLAYTPPQITAFSVYRTASAAANAPAASGGAYAAVRYAYSVPSLNGGNTAAMTVRTKRATEAAYSQTLLSGTAMSADTTGRPGAVLSADYRWDVQMTVTDAFGASATATAQLPTAEVILDIAANGKGIGIGKTAEVNGLDIAWPVFMRDDTLLKSFLLAAHPVGSYYWSSDGTSPATLFGGTWTQITGRFLLAAGGGYAVNATGGEAAHTLSVAEMPSHTHSYAYFTNWSGHPNAGYRIDSDASGDSNQSISYTGGSQPHNNMPPYIAAYCWRRTA